MLNPLPIETSTPAGPAVTPGRTCALMQDNSLRCWGAGEPFAQLRPEQLEVHLLIGADTALEGDRDELVGLVEHVHPAVVVIDDLADLLDDRPADRFDRVLTAHPGRGGLQLLVELR